MMKTLTALGICAAIVFAPLAAIAQTDTTAPAADAMSKDSMSKDAMKKPMKHKKHMSKMKKPMAAPAEAPKS